MVRELPRRARARFTSWRPEQGDAALYAASGLFAGLTAAFSSITLYQQWGLLALGPYLLAAVLSLALDRYRPRTSVVPAVGEGPALAGASGAPGALAGAPGGRWRAGRIWIFVLVLLGATLLPLSLEVAWRGEGGNPSAHVQPEVVVVEQAGHRLAHGKDPYLRVTNPKGRVVLHVPGQPTYESFFPYLPLMTVFGLPSSTKEPIELTDARIFFSLFTLVVVAGALALYRGPTRAAGADPAGAHRLAHGRPPVGHRG